VRIRSKKRGTEEEGGGEETNTRPKGRGLQKGGVETRKVPGLYPRLNPEGREARGGSRAQGGRAIDFQAVVKSEIGKVILISRKVH